MLISQHGQLLHTFPRTMFSVKNFTVGGYSCMPDKIPIDRRISYPLASNLYKVHTPYWMSLCKGVPGTKSVPGWSTASYPARFNPCDPACIFLHTTAALRSPAIYCNVCARLSLVTLLGRRLSEENCFSARRILRSCYGICTWRRTQNRLCPWWMISRWCSATRAGSLATLPTTPPAA